MDFVNKAFAQLADLFKSLSVGARMTAGLLLVVVVVSLAYLFKTQNAGADALLMGGEPFAAAQLPAMEAAFSKAGLIGYEIDGNRVRVPRGQQSAYMGALADAGVLPPEFGKYLEGAVKSSGMMQSNPQREDAKRVAKQQELQLILLRMKGIESASVLYDEKKDSRFGQPVICTASVNIKPIGTQPLEAERIPMVRHLVAAAFAGLKPESVSVTDLNGRNYSAAGPDGKLGDALENPYLNLKKAYEREYVNKVTDALQYIPGVVVSATVELNPETGFEENKVVLDPKAVIYQEETQSTTKNVDGPAPAGRPGVVANAAGSANQPGAVGAGGGGPKVSEETSRETKGSAIPTTTTKRTMQGLTPTMVKLAVSIPRSYYEKVWLQRNPAVDGQAPAKVTTEQLAAIEQEVKTNVENSVVGLLPTEDRARNLYSDAKVVTIDAIPGAALAMPTLQDNAMAWLGQYWTTLGLSALAIFSLLILRSTVRSVPSAPPSSLNAEVGDTLSLSHFPGDDDKATGAATENEPATPRNRLKRRGVSGPSLRDELAVMVKEDPDSAVAVLRNWIGAGA